MPQTIFGAHLLNLTYVLYYCKLSFSTRREMIIYTVSLYLIEHVKMRRERERQKMILFLSLASFCSVQVERFYVYNYIHNHAEYCSNKHTLQRKSHLCIPRKGFAGPQS